MQYMSYRTCKHGAPLNGTLVLLHRSYFGIMGTTVMENQMEKRMQMKWKLRIILYELSWITQVSTELAFENAKCTKS